MHVIPELRWKLLYNWYCKITVIVKWKTLSKPIKVCKGTRQGGLTSPFIFNVGLFYIDYIDMLSSHEGGNITTNDVRFNIFCFADDTLLTIMCSTMVFVIIPKKQIVLLWAITLYYRTILVY